METETIVQVIAMCVLGILQFLLVVIVGMGAFIFKTSMSNLKESFTNSLNNLDRTVQEVKQDRTQDNSTLYGKINVIEKDYADRSEVFSMIDDRLPRATSR